MKTWITMLSILIAVFGLCIWDGVHTQKVFDKLEHDSEEVYNSLLTTSISDENLQEKIVKLNDYWTAEMDTLCISISRKDLQPISDYLQFLFTSIKNNNQEDAITYSRLLNYNLIGLNQTTGLNFLNLL